MLRQHFILVLFGPAFCNKNYFCKNIDIVNLTLNFVDLQLIFASASTFDISIGIFLSYILVSLSGNQKKRSLFFCY